MNNNLDEKLVSAYIGSKYEKFKNKHFSFPSLFFSWEYIAYRKFYSLLLIYVILERIFSAVLSSVLKEKAFLVICIFIPNIILALIFNKLYLSNAKKEVNKIKDSNLNASEDELINICSKKGGVSIVSLIVAILIIMIVNAILRSL